MRRIERIGRFLFIVAALVVSSVLGALLVGPYRHRVALLLRDDAVRVVLLTCLAIVCVQVLVSIVCLVFERPEPRSMRLAGSEDIEVSREAIESIARVAARRDDVLIEDVRARVAGPSRDHARIRIEAIALTQQSLSELAGCMQRAVQRACDEALGLDGATVCVCFLPSKTTTVTREVTGE